MAENSAAFSFEKFETLCYTRDRERAARELIKLLATVDNRYGALDTITAEVSDASVSPGIHFLTRITSAISALFSDPKFFLSPNGFDQLISWQRWLAALFAASPFGNADHILRAMNVKGEGKSLELNETGFTKFCLLYAPDSQISADVQTLWTYNKKLSAALFFALMSPRFLGTPNAHGKREALLGWLPERLGEIEDVDMLPQGVLHDVYMNCSYADRPDKHEIKRAIHRLVRKKNLERGYTDLDLTEPRGTQNGKPVLMVVLEWFSRTHSVYRTHSTSMRALRERFHVVGLGTEAQVEQAVRDVFEEFVPLTGNMNAMLDTVRGEAARRKPAAIYYPSIGMFPSTIYLANMRLAPIQVTALGHGASSMSPFIDYYAVDEDFAGDPDTFSEKLLLLPKDAMPHVRSADARELVPQLREKPDVVRVAVASTTMKLNPRMMKALKQIKLTARTPVQFEFLIGFANGLVREQVRNFIQRYIPDATIHPHQPYAQYMDCINGCDLYLNPFPYGNMNGIADMAMAGLVGVCRTGPQIHERIDGAMFRRMQLPEWLIAKTDDEYVAAAVRLIDGHKERLALRRGVIARGGDRVFQEGRPNVLGDTLASTIAS